MLSTNNEKFKLQRALQFLVEMQASIVSNELHIEQIKVEIPLTQIKLNNLKDKVLQLELDSVTSATHFTTLLDDLRAEFATKLNEVPNFFVFS